MSWYKDWKGQRAWSGRRVDNNEMQEVDTGGLIGPYGLQEGIWISSQVLHKTSKQLAISSLEFSKGLSGFCEKKYMEDGGEEE